MRVLTTAAMVALGAVLMGWLPISPLMADHDTQDLKRHSSLKRPQSNCAAPMPPSLRLTTRLFNA